MSFLSDRSNYLADQHQYYLYEVVTNELCLKLRQEIKLDLSKQYKDLTRHPITLRINTIGGSVPDGVALGRVLQACHDIPIVTHVSGVRFSMGLVLAQFGHVRRIDQTALVMLHDVTMNGVSGGNNLDHQGTLALHNLHRRNVSNIFAARNTAGHNDPKWWLQEFFVSSDRYLDAQEALALGLFDEIVGNYPNGS